MKKSTPCILRLCTLEWGKIFLWVSMAIYERGREIALFIGRWILSPIKIGAVLPSSRALANLMAKSAVAQLRDGEYVLEIGAGTGRFTSALLNAGVPPHRLVCVEQDPKLAAFLKKKFSSVFVICGNACYVESLISKDLRHKFGAVVSGLPMVGIPLLVQEAILNSCFRVMRPGGVFVQFTYKTLFSSVKTDQLSLQKRRIGTVLFNIPPATVWVYTRNNVTEEEAA